MKRNPFNYTMARNPQQPKFKRPQPKITPVYLGDLMIRAAQRRRARQTKT